MGLHRLLVGALPLGVIRAVFAMSATSPVYL